MAYSPGEDRGKRLGAVPRDVGGARVWKSPQGSCPFSSVDAGRLPREGNGCRVNTCCHLPELLTERLTEGVHDRNDRIF